MADIVIDGRTTVWWLPTIASPTLAPTVSEIAAGHRISKWMIPTGLEGFEATQADIPNSGFESTYDTNLPGRKSQTGTSITLKDQTAADTAYAAAVAAMAEYTDGYVVIRDDVLAETAVAATTQKVESHPARTGLHQVLGRGEANSLKRLRIMTTITAEPKKKLAILT